MSEVINAIEGKVLLDGTVRWLDRDAHVPYSKGRVE